VSISDDITNDTLWQGNIVTCPICNQLGTLVRRDAKGGDGRTGDAFSVGHVNIHGKMDVCIYNWTQNKVERVKLGRD
jgi:hypothetical protein